jgi:hypothetical protein
MVLALWCVYMLCWCTTVVVFRTCDMPVSFSTRHGEAISLTQTGQACNHMCTYIQYVRTYIHTHTCKYGTYILHTYCMMSCVVAVESCGRGWHGMAQDGRKLTLLGEIKCEERSGDVGEETNCMEQLGLYDGISASVCLCVFLRALYVRT